jgi:hypothetical protein
VSDITIEKLGSLLQENPLGLLLLRDELAAWVGSFDRYAAGGKGADQPAWMSMYDAAPLTIDRKHSERSIFIERAAVSVLGTIQPGTLARIFARAEREAGLLARVLLAYPPERPGLWTDEELPESVAADWSGLLGALLALKADWDEHGGPQPRLTPIGADAKPIWIDWHDPHARETDEVGDDDLRAHFAKLKGACARLALVIACVDAVTSGREWTLLTVHAMRRAILLTEWLKREARRVYGILGGNEEEVSKERLQEWIRARGGSATVRDLTHGLRGFKGDPVRR